MPLKKGSSPATVARNIKEMVATGMPPKRAVAAALRSAHPHAAKTHAAAKPKAPHRLAPAPPSYLKKR